MSLQSPRAERGSATRKSRSKKPAAGPRPKTPADTEVELKLVCEPDCLEEVAGARVIESYPQVGWSEAELVATYFDTAKLELGKAGQALRVRGDGKTFVLTFKSRRSDGDVLARDELEMPVTEAVPKSEALLAVLPEAVAARLKSKRLRPLFMTKVRRRSRTLETPLGAIEVALDEGEITAGDRREPVSEIELELLEGKPEALFRLARELVGKHPLRPSLRSKSERGVSLATGEKPPFVKAQKFRIDDGAMLDGLLETAFRQAFRHLLANQAAAEAQEAEGIHQYRVALRRLRSFLDLIGPIAPGPELDDLRAEARWLMSELGPARDWDVFVTHTLPKAFAEQGEAGRLETLQGVAEERRAEARKAAQAAIRGSRAAQFLIGIGLWIEQKGWLRDASTEGEQLLAAHARDYAGQVLRELRRKVLKRGRRFERLSPEERHRVRLALKKLRYTADFFLPLFGGDKAGRRFTKCLTDFQEELGRYNDAATAAKLGEQLAGAGAGDDGRRAGEEVRAALGAPPEGDEERLLAAWARFKDAELPG